MLSRLNQHQFLCASSDFGPNPGIVEGPGDLSFAPLLAPRALSLGQERAMAAQKRLQAEIDKLLKKVDEGRPHDFREVMR